jgi:hypothetical protein
MHKEKPNTLILEIQLRDATIPVWRIIEVPVKISLHELHLYVQIAMGWTCSHLYEFQIEDIFYQYIFPGEFVEHPEDKIVKDSLLFILKDFNFEVGTRFSYEYDFGDGWDHDIIVKSFSVKQGSILEAPCCSAGAMACPVEDMGGISAYNELIQIKLGKRLLGKKERLGDDFKDFDIYKVDSIRSFSFEARAKALRKAYH